MIKTPLSTVIGGAFWTPKATIVGSASKTLSQLIKSLFANNEQGFAYDPNDLTTMFQDSAGTVPVTGVDQPVGLIKDKSGRNNHARQTTSASRPILRQNAVTGANYLEFDGTDDSLVTNSIDFTATDEVSLFAGVRKMSDTQRAILCELSIAAGGNTGSFCIEAPRLTGVLPGDYSSTAQGVSSSTTTTGVGAYLSPNSAVIALRAKNSANLHALKVNNLTYSSPTSLGLSNFGNYPLYIGRRAGTSLPFNGHIYGLIGVGRLTTDAETTALEKLIAKNTGVALSV